MPLPRAGLQVALRALPLVALLALAACKEVIVDPDPLPIADAVVVDVDLDTDSAKLVIPDTVRVGATVTDSKGATATAVTLAWTSSDPDVLRSLGNGTFVAVAPGSALIVATAEGVSGVARVAVVEADIFDNVVVADSAFRVLSDSAEIASGTLRMARVGNLDPVAVGDVLVGTEEGGFLRKVTAVQSNGAEVVVSTAPATLIEAIKEGTIEFEDNTTFAQAAARAVADPSRFLAPPRQGIEVQPDGTVRFDAATFDFTSTTSVGIGPLTGSVSVDGDLTIKIGDEAMKGGKTAGFTAEIETFLGLPTSLERLEFNTATAVSLDATLTTKVVGSLSSAIGKEVFREEIFKLDIGQKVIWVGPVPVLVKLSLPVDAYAVVTAQVEASMAISSSMDAGAQSGLVWTPKNGFKTSFSQYGNATLGDPEWAVGGRLGLRFGVDPKLQLSFYAGLGAVEAGVDGAIDANVYATTPYRWDGQVAALLDLFIGANMDLWGLIDLSTRGEWHVWADTLYRASGDLAYVQLAPGSLTMDPGKTATATAKALTLVGDIDLGLAPQAFDWSVSPSSIATVNSQGLVTGVSTGSAKLTAMIRGTSIKAEIPVTVAQPALVLQACFGEPDWALSGPPGGACPTGQATPSFTRGTESSWVWMKATVPGSGAQTGVTYTAKDPFTGQTVTPIASVNQWYVYRFPVPANAATGDYKASVGPATKAGLKDAAAVEVPFKVDIGKLGIGACLSTDASSAFDPDKHCPSTFQTVGVTPGQTFYLWYGADGPDKVALCGVQIAVKNPFTGVVGQYVIPSDQPAPCLSRLTFVVPQGTPPGTYTMVIGPASKAGYADAPPFNFPFPVR